MGKKNTTRTTARTSKSAMDSAERARSSTAKRSGEPAREFMEVGQEVVPGMRLRCICRGHTGTIGRIAWSPCGRFIALPSEEKTICISTGLRAEKG